MPTDDETPVIPLVSTPDVVAQLKQLGAEHEPRTDWQERMLAAADGKRLRINPHSVGLVDLSEQVAEQVAAAMHHYALAVSRGDAAQAFCVLAAALGSFADRTDAPVDLINIAIDLLVEHRAELIAEGHGPVLELVPPEAG